MTSIHYNTIQNSTDVNAYRLLITVLTNKKKATVKSFKMQK